MNVDLDNDTKIEIMLKMHDFFTVTRWSENMLQAADILGIKLAELTANITEEFSDSFVRQLAHEVMDWNASCGNVFELEDRTILVTLVGQGTRIMIGGDRERLRPPTDREQKIYYRLMALAEKLYSADNTSEQQN